MKVPSLLLASAILVACASAPAQAQQHTHAQLIENLPAVQSSTLLRGIRKCAQSLICRTLAVELVNRLADQLVKQISDLKTEITKQLRKLLLDIVQAAHHRDVLVKLDRLETLLKQNGVYCPELQHKIEVMRALHW